MKTSMFLTLVNLTYTTLAIPTPNLFSTREVPCAASNDCPNGQTCDLYNGVCSVPAPVKRAAEVEGQKGL